MISHKFVTSEFEEISIACTVHYLKIVGNIIIRIL